MAVETMAIAKRATTGTTAASTVVKDIPTSDLDGSSGSENMSKQ